MRRSKSKPSRAGVSYIDSAKGLAAAATRLSKSPLVAFDTEFLWERSYSPRLALIQVADKDQVWLVDPLKLSSEQMRPLLDVLVSPESLKVAHAIDQDQLCLHSSYAIVAEPVLDTSIAAALTGMGDQIGLSTLLGKLLHVPVNKGYSRTNWLKRPLPPAMREYAAGDVRHLTRAAEILRKHLRKLSREQWALDLSAKQGEFARNFFDPESHARRIARGRKVDETTFKVLRELAVWREDAARIRDLPRRWVAEDKMLIKLATARPTQAKQLKDFRGVNIKAHPKGPQRVLEAIQRGIKAKEAGYAPPKRKRGPTPKESAALVVLRCFLSTLAADNQMPLRMLVESDRMLDLLRGRFKSVKALGASGILEPRVVEIVGEDLVAILNGRRGLRIVNGVATQMDA